MIEIKCFGMSREIARSDGRLSLPQTQMTVEELRAWLEDQYGSQLSMEGYMIAVNQEYALDSTVITDADEVAIIPPVSGG